MDNIFRYYFRSPDFEVVQDHKSTTVVVFIHGILSHSKSAFTLTERRGYFWDIVSKFHPFDNMDFGLFSYGKLDISYLLEGDSPYNNLIRISQELHGIINGYDNVIFIAHSQGGLLAKTYASLYYDEQSIFLCTLHTPHRNKSFSVLRFKKIRIWSDLASFRVPHLFCGSVNDNKIVKPDNATLGARCYTYMSTDRSKYALGHGHLCRSPDTEFVEVLINSVYQFHYSGFRKDILVLGNEVTKSASNEIMFSSLKESTDGYTLMEFADFLSPNIDFANILKRHEKIAFINTSIGFIERLLYEKYRNIVEKIRIIDKDSGPGCAATEINNKLCEEYFSLGDNPYSSLPFDAFSFGRKSLITNLQFLESLKILCRRKNFNIQDQVLEGGDRKLCDLYKDCAKAYWDNLVKKVYDACFAGQRAPRIGVVAFGRAIIHAIKKILEDDDNRVEYSVVYELIVKSLSEKGQICDIRTVEIVASNLFRSDSHLYWLDRDVKLVFKTIEKGDAGVGRRRLCRD